LIFLLLRALGKHKEEYFLALIMVKFLSERAKV